MARSLRRLKTETSVTPDVLNDVQRHCLPLTSDADLAPLIQRIGDAKLALLGEASHGTSQFYKWRCRITQQLLLNQNFSFIAVEGDWPDCYRLNRFVKGYPDAGKNAQEVLSHFHRWPTWMWANEEVARFLEWLKDYNKDRPMDKKVGFYGLDVYSLWESMNFLANHRSELPEEATEALQKVIKCFSPYNEEPQDYAHASRFYSCEKEVSALVDRLTRLTIDAGHTESEAAFNTQQNAFAVQSAEGYYRIMMKGGPDSWNLRDTHMMDTLDRLMDFHGPESRGIVWAHNTHVGDARFTDMLDEGEINIGQLARERYQEQQVALVGFGSHHGTVTAGRSWDAPMETMRMPSGRTGSWEDILHRTTPADKLLIFSGLEHEAVFMDPRGHRAVGVVYRPEMEHLGNYVPTILARRYDAFLFIDETSALRVLGVHAEGHQVPDTYPFTV